MVAVLRWVLAFTLLYVSYTSAAAIQDVVNIFDGHLAKPGEYPYTVSIQKEGGAGNEHCCGGSIIDKHHVLTSALCCVKCFFYGTKDTFIAAGVTNKSDEAHMVKKEIESQHPHESFYLETFVNDICVIKIKGEFQFNKYVKAVQLDSNPAKEQTKCSLSGWGAWKPDSEETPDALKGTVVPIANQKQCAEHYKTLKVELDTMVCAGHEDIGSSSCTGDFGSPLVCNNKQTGITSIFERCNKTGFPGVYTRVDRYVNWIKSHGVHINED